MKQKAIRIGLALLVLLVWGAVIARAFQKSGSDSDVDPPIIERAPSPVEVARKPLRFSVERDPFLDGKSQHTSRAARTTVPRAHAPVPRAVVATPPPAVATKATIAYVGYIRNSSADGKACVILRINGREQVVMVGGEHGGLLVLDASANKLTISHGGEVEVISRSR